MQTFCNFNKGINGCFYGSGGIAPKEQNASGFRLLAVDSSAREKALEGD